MPNIDEILNVSRAYSEKFGRDHLAKIIKEHGGQTHPRSVPDDRQESFVAGMRDALGDDAAPTEKKPPMSPGEIHAELEGMNKKAFAKFNSVGRNKR